jgi:uncharacterized membrane protein YqaE (UPF0057 family)
MRIRLLLATIFLSMILAPITSSAYIVPVTNTNVPNEAVTNALNEFKGLSKKERKSRIADVKKELREFRKKKDADEKTILLVILAILLPPLAVYLHQGEINNKFWISLLLTLIFWLPGVIYALFVILGGA